MRRGLGFGARGVARGVGHDGGVIMGMAVVAVSVHQGGQFDGSKSKRHRREGKGIGDHLESDVIASMSPERRGEQPHRAEAQHPPALSDVISTRAVLVVTWMTEVVNKRSACDPLPHARRRPKDAQHHIEGGNEAMHWRKYAAGQSRLTYLTITRVPTSAHPKIAPMIGIGTLTHP